MKDNDSDYSRVNAARRRLQIEQSIEYKYFYQEKRQNRNDNNEQAVFYHRPKDLKIG